MAATQNYITQDSADARYQVLSGIGTDTPTTSAVGDAAAAGASTAASRGDHKHAREAFATPVADSPTGNAAGSAATLPRSDHVHQGTGTLSGGYSAAVANQGGITTETSLTNLSVTVTTVAGRRYRISAETAIESTVAGDTPRVSIKEGGTILAQAQLSVAIANQAYTFVKSAVVTPSAGAHTYNVTLLRAAGTGTMQLDSGPSSFILVEDIGT